MVDMESVLPKTCYLVRRDSTLQFSCLGNSKHERYIGNDARLIESIAPQPFTAAASTGAWESARCPRSSRQSFWRHTLYIVMCSVGQAAEEAPLAKSVSPAIREATAIWCGARVSERLKGSAKRPKSLQTSIGIRNINPLGPLSISHGGRGQSGRAGSALRRNSRGVYCKGHLAVTSDPGYGCRPLLIENERECRGDGEQSR